MNIKKLLFGITLFVLYGTYNFAARAREINITLRWGKSIGRDAVAFVEGKKTYPLDEKCNYEIICSRKITIDASTLPFQFNISRAQREISLDSLSSAIQHRLHGDKKLTHYAIQKININDDFYEPSDPLNKISYANFINTNIIFELRPKDPKSGSLHSFSFSPKTAESKTFFHKPDTVKIQWNNSISTYGILKKQYCPATPNFSKSQEINPRKCSIVYQRPVEIDFQKITSTNSEKVALLSQIVDALCSATKKDPDLRRYTIIKLLKPAETSLNAPLKITQEELKDLVFLIEKNKK